MLAPLEVLELYPPHDHTLAGLFASRGAADPDRLVLTFNDKAYSWRQLGEEVDRVCALLDARGITKGDRVGIAAANSDAHAVLLLAAARLGAIMVPLNPNFGVPELTYILGHAGVSGIVVSQATKPTILSALKDASIDPWMLELDAEPAGARDYRQPAPSNAPAPAGAADDTCLIIYTSGTTGLPKGVMHSQRTYVLCAEVASGRTGLQPDDNVLIILPFFHVNALFYSLGSILAAGARGVILPRFSASAFWDNVVETQATQVNIIEAIGNILQKRSRDEFRPGHKLRVVYGVRESFVRTFREDFNIPVLVIGFGMTECPGVICNPLTGPSKPGSIGVLGAHPDSSRPWTQARITDDDGHDVQTGDVGELWLKSPTMMQGYFKDTKHTADAHRDGWFTTGDLVRRDADGYFYFVSRKKDIIRRRGENISGAELDRVIGEHPGVYEAAAIAVPADLGEDEILVAVVCKTGVRLEAEEVAQWCRERLAPMKVPRFVCFVDALPHTPTHKVAKAVMRADASLRQNAIDLEKQAV